jgi:hypothetical protein
MQAVCQRMKSLNTPRNWGISNLLNQPLSHSENYQIKMRSLKIEFSKGILPIKTDTQLPTPNSIPVRTTPQSTNGCMLANIDDSLMR